MDSIRKRLQEIKLGVEGYNDPKEYHILHFVDTKALARELGVSQESVDFFMAGADIPTLSDFVLPGVGQVRIEEDDIPFLMKILSSGSLYILIDTDRLAHEFGLSPDYVEKVVREQHMRTLTEYSQELESQMKLISSFQVQIDHLPKEASWNTISNGDSLAEERAWANFVFDVLEYIFRISNKNQKEIWAGVRSMYKHKCTPNEIRLVLNQLLEAGLAWKDTSRRSDPSNYWLVSQLQSSIVEYLLAQRNELIEKFCINPEYRNETIVSFLQKEVRIRGYRR